MTTSGDVAPQTLVDRLGGSHAACLIAADVFDRVLADPVLTGHLDSVDDEAFDRAAGHLLDALAVHCADPALIDDVILRVAALRPLIARSRRT